MKTIIFILERIFNHSFADVKKLMDNRIAHSTLSSALSKISLVLVTLITVPLTYRYLGQERFGLWMTITTVASLLGFADFGISNGIVNSISEKLGKSDKNGIKKIISSGYGALIAISLFFIFAIVLLSSFLPLPKIFNLGSSISKEELEESFIFFVILSLISIPTSVIQKIQAGMQELYIANYWQIASNFLMLIAIILAAHFKMSLPYLILASLAPPIITSLLNSILYFGFLNKSLRPSLNWIDLRSMKRIVTGGFLFFVLQLAGIAAFQTDILIISNWLGPAAVSDYSVLFRLFSLPSTVLGFFLTALWPAYGEAFGRRDFPWIRNIYYRSLRYSFFLNIPLTILLIIFANQIVSYWLNVHVEYSNLLIAGMGGWSLLTVLGGNFSTLLNGLQVVKFQVITSVIMALVNIVLSIYLVKKLGISGPILASLISLVAFSYIPSYFYIKKIIFRKEF